MAHPQPFPARVGFACWQHPLCSVAAADTTQRVRQTTRPGVVRRGIPAALRCPSRRSIGPQSQRSIGRRPVTARPGFPEKWDAVRTELQAGRISRSEAARRLECGYATLLRLLSVTALQVPS